jgi:hypothetical protein
MDQQAHHNQIETHNFAHIDTYTDHRFEDMHMDQQIHLPSVDDDYFWEPDWGDALLDADISRAQEIDEGLFAALRFNSFSPNRPYNHHPALSSKDSLTHIWSTPSRVLHEQSSSSPPGQSPGIHHDIQSLDSRFYGSSRRKRPRNSSELGTSIGSLGLTHKPYTKSISEIATALSKEALVECLVELARRENQPGLNSKKIQSLLTTRLPNGKVKFSGFDDYKNTNSVEASGNVHAGTFKAPAESILLR